MRILIYTCKGITSYHVLSNENEILPYLFKILSKDAYYDDKMSDMHCVLNDNDITWSIVNPYTQEKPPEGITPKTTAQG